MNNTDLRNFLVQSLSASLDKLSIMNNGVRRKDIFICPICLQIFNLSECLNNGNIISLEDVPPKSLGGHPLTITCKSCNNKCGHDLDTYLVNEIKNGHIIQLSERNKQKGTISEGITKVNGQLSIDLNNKIISAEINEDNNNPSSIDIFKSIVEKAYASHTPIDLKLKITGLKRCPEVLNTSILKNAYLLAFYILGYKYILRSNLDIVRRQILWPKQKILNSNPVIFLDENFLKDFDDGAYLVSIDNQQCIGIIISLKLKKTSIVHRGFVILPDYKDKDSRIYSQVLCKRHERKVSIIAKFKKVSK